MSRRREVVMLCTASRGGMRTVLEGYRADGLFERYGVRWIATHDEGSLARRLGLAARALAVFAGLLLRRRVALVHSHMAMRGSFWRKSIFNALARGFGVPVIAHLHGSEFRAFHAALRPWQQALVAREFRRCRAVLVLSEGWAEFVRGVAPGARVVVQPNHVHVPPWRAAAPLPGGEVQLLFLGLVGPRKGVHVLLPAFARALARAPGLRLRLGGTVDVDRVRDEARTLGIGERLEFLGWVAGDDKDRQLQQAHLYVLPSFNEGLPMSLLEAMAAGLPVISTRVGGIPELVRDGVDGLLVEAGDVDALAEAIATLAADPARCAACGAAARARVVAGFSDSVLMPRLHALYDTVLDGAGA